MGQHHTWKSDQARTDDLTRWLHRYNHDRYLAAIDGPPISRVNNLRDRYTWPDRLRFPAGKRQHTYREAWQAQPGCS